MDEVISLVKLAIVCQALPETFESIVQKSRLYLLPFLQVIAQFSADVLYPPLKVLLILGQFIQIRREYLKLPYLVHSPLMFDIPHQDIDNLQPIDIQLLRAVIVHISQHHFAGLINNLEDKIESLIVLPQRNVLMDVVKFLQTLLLHKEIDVLGTEFVVALAFDSRTLGFCLKGLETA